MPKDTVYVLRLISAEDASPLRFATIEARSSGIRIASWQADVDGYIKISKKETGRSPHTELLLQYPGFEKLKFELQQLPVNNTLVVTVQSKPAEFDEICITAYRVPLIEKPQKFRMKRHRTSPEAEEVFPVYSASQCIAYEALQQGLWLHKDTLARNCLLAWDTLNRNMNKGTSGYGFEGLIRRYFITNISYPRQAQDFMMEEKVYLSFELDEKGNVSYIKVLKGKHIDLVLEAANALARMPRLNLKAVFSEYQDSYPPQIPKQVRLILPVKFILQ